MSTSKKPLKEGKMKKYLKTAILGATASVFFATGAFASALDTQGGSGTNGCYTVSQEWLNYMDVDTSNVPASGIDSDNDGTNDVLLDLTYTPTIDLGVNNIIVVTFNGGALKATPGNVMYLAIDNDGGGAPDTVVAQMIDYTTDANGNYTSITLKFTQAVPSGTTMWLVNTDNATANTDGDLGGTNDIDVPGFFAITYQNSTRLTAQVTSAQDDTGTPLNAPLTAVEDVTCSSQQISLAVAETEDTSNADPALDIIDVNPPLYRTGFLDDDGDNNNFDSDVTVTVINNQLDVPLQVDNNDNIKIVLKGDFTGVQSVTATDEANNNINGTTDPNGNYVLSSAFVDNDNDGDAELDLLITVDGQTPLNPQTILSDITFDFNEILATDDTVLATDRPIIKWDINGAQFKVPYLFNNANTWVRISNDGPVAGEITVDVFDENGNKQSNVSLGTVSPNSSVLIYASDIVNAAINAGWSATNVTRFTAIFTVAAPAGNISAVAVQRIPGGVDRVIPVLDSEGVWDQ